jgi:hypothetical protein
LAAQRGANESVPCDGWSRNAQAEKSGLVEWLELAELART